MATTKPKTNRTKPTKAAKSKPAKEATRTKATPPKASRVPFSDRARFVKETPGTLSSSHAGSWKRPKGVTSSNTLTEFLGRLWALFGAPSSDNGKGFEYDLRDTVTGEVLQAYSAASGPSFGNAEGKRGAAVDALEALINATSPVDCETTVDYGASRIGIAKGKHFYDYDGPDDDSFAD